MTRLADSDTIRRATCSACGCMFWATEAYVANVQAGKTESLCRNCDDPEPLNMEDDDSEQYDFVEPEPMEGLV